jgi:hypothetical protein
MILVNSYFVDVVKEKELAAKINTLLDEEGVYQHEVFVDAGSLVNADERIRYSQVTARHARGTC